MLSGKEARKSRPIHRRIGPGIFVTAAFIGPGTVLSASQAGADFGFTLLWAVVFSVVTAMILQEMAARLGIVSGRGLAESIRATMSSPALRWTMFALVLSAILLGNSAYQTGNILGAAAGLNLATGISDRVWCILIAAVALSLIGIGRFEVLQWLLMTLVGLMGAIFALSAIICGPDLIAVLAGLRPSLPDSGGLIVIGLIGTTVVPYNLFLHSSSAAERYGEYRDKRMAIRDSLFDLVLSIMVGGIISASLLITAAVTFPEGGLDSIADIAQQLRPTLGTWAETWFALGLFAAGLTSSITAPLAAGYAAAGCFGWPANLSSRSVRVTAALVVAMGLIAALAAGGSPRETIILAQAANGLLLPALAAFLLYTMNRENVMGELRNGRVANLLGMIVLAVTMLIAGRQLGSVWRQIEGLW